MRGVFGSSTRNRLRFTWNIVKLVGIDRLANEPIDVGLEVAGRADRHGGNTTGPRRASDQTSGLVRLTIERQAITPQGE